MLLKVSKKKISARSVVLNALIFPRGVSRLSLFSGGKKNHHIAVEIGQRLRNQDETRSTMLLFGTTSMFSHLNLHFLYLSAARTCANQTLYSYYKINLLKPGPQDRLFLKDFIKHFYLQMNCISGKTSPPAPHLKCLN